MGKSKETIKCPDNKDNKNREKQWSPEYNGNYSVDRHCTAIDKIYSLMIRLS